MVRIAGNDDTKGDGADLSTRARLATYPNARLLAMLGDARDEPEGEPTLSQGWGFAKRAIAADILAERGLVLWVVGPDGRCESAINAFLRRYSDASASLFEVMRRLMGVGPATSEPEPESKTKKKGRRPR